MCRLIKSTLAIDPKPTYYFFIENTDDLVDLFDKSNSLETMRFFRWCDHRNPKNPEQFVSRMKEKCKDSAGVQRIKSVYIAPTIFKDQRFDPTGELQEECFPLLVNSGTRIMTVSSKPRSAHPFWITDVFPSIEGVASLLDDLLVHQGILSPKNVEIHVS